jgi:hypothetical protein
MNIHEESMGQALALAFKGDAIGVHRARRG